VIKYNVNTISAIGIVSLLSILYLLKRQKLPFPRRPANWTMPGQTITKWQIPKKGLKYKKDFDRATLIYQLPKNLLARMAKQESDFRPNVISRAGAVGLMQIIPRFHPRVDPTDPIASIYYAAKYMRKLYNRVGSNWTLALAAYNWGIGNLNKYGLNRAPTETKNYIAKITNDVF